jgi:AAA family ATP:ADP antiporter
MARGGASLAILVMPIVSLMGQAAMAISGLALLVVAIAKVAENSVDYSIQNTARNALFLVTDAETKYKVKVLLDSVLVRLGDVLAGALVAIGSTVLGLGALGFVGVGAGVTLVWGAIALALSREHRSRAATFDPSKS